MESCHVIIIIIIIIVYYATKAAHRKHAPNIETIKHDRTKSTKTKMTNNELWYNTLSQTLLLSRASIHEEANESHSSVVVNRRKNISEKELSV